MKNELDETVVIKELTPKQTELVVELITDRIRSINVLVSINNIEKEILTERYTVIRDRITHY